MLWVFLYGYFFVRVLLPFYGCLFSHFSLNKSTILAWLLKWAEDNKHFSLEVNLWTKAGGWALSIIAHLIIRSCWNLLPLYFDFHLSCQTFSKRIFPNRLPNVHITLNPLQQLGFFLIIFLKNCHQSSDVVSRVICGWVLYNNDFLSLPVKRSLGVLNPLTGVNVIAFLWPIIHVIRNHSSRYWALRPTDFHRRSPALSLSDCCNNSEYIKMR